MAPVAGLRRPALALIKNFQASALRLKCETIFSTSTEQSTPPWFLNAADFLLRMIFSFAVRTLPQAHSRCIKFVSFLPPQKCMFACLHSLRCRVKSCIVCFHVTVQAKQKCHFLLCFLSLFQSSVRKTW